MTAALVLLAALPLVVLVTFHLGHQRGERVGEARGRRARWQMYDEHWRDQWDRIEP